jgi:AcrR family transcriptional regulator
VNANLQCGGERLIRNKKDIKSLVIQATFELIIESGINELTTAKIAERAGTAETVIYRHFKNKQDIINQLFSSIFQRLRDGYEAIRMEPEPVLVRLDKLLDFHLSFMEKTKGFSRLIFSEQIHLGTAERREMVKNYAENYELVVMDILRDGIEEGCFRADLDVKTAAQGYIGLIYLVMNKWSVEDFSWSLLDEKIRILQFWTKLWK